MLLPLGPRLHRSENRAPRRAGESAVHGIHCRSLLVQREGALVVGPEAAEDAAGGSLG
jgi:hypothetical protein